MRACAPRPRGPERNERNSGRLSQSGRTPQRRRHLGEIWLTLPPSSPPRASVTLERATVGSTAASGPPRCIARRTTNSRLSKLAGRPDVRPASALGSSWNPKERYDDGQATSSRGDGRAPINGRGSGLGDPLSRRIPDEVGRRHPGRSRLRPRDASAFRRDARGRGVKAR